MDSFEDHDGTWYTSARTEPPSWAPWLSACGSNGALASKFNPFATGVPLGRTETVGLQVEGRKEMGQISLSLSQPAPKSVRSTHARLASLREARRATGTAAMSQWGQRSGAGLVGRRRGKADCQTTKARLGQRSQLLVRLTPASFPGLSTRQTGQSGAPVYPLPFRFPLSASPVESI